MLCEIITIGTEILIGQIIDSNSAFLGKSFNDIGLEVVKITSISDKRADMLNAFENAKKSADVVIITGGLGPTNDDITKKVLMEFFGGELILNQEALENVERLFEKFGRKVSEVNRQQAFVPSTCEALINEKGTAPGMWFENEGKVFVSLPGVPYEMKWLINEKVIPKLKSTFTFPSIVHHTILTSGKGESEVAEMLIDFEKNLPAQLSLAYLPSPGRVRLRLSGKANDAEQLRSVFDDQLTQLKELVKEITYGEGDQDIAWLLGEKLKKQGMRLSTAESCTGGKIAHKLTSNAGSSDYFEGSVVAYTEEVKMNQLSVKKETLKSFGVVSNEIAIEMAKGACEKFKTKCAIATTGIAGPTETGDGNPVGTVCIATIFDQETEVVRYQFGGDRSKVIERASVAGINQLLQLMRKHGA